MNIIRVFLFYNFGLRAHPRYYSEKGGMPPMVNTFLDMGVQKISRGRKGFVGVRNYEHDCPVCQVHFWSDRKEEKSCGRWKCFKEVWGKV
jgi:hypothetical protein